jgi:hypothetical protein
MELFSRLLDNLLVYGMGGVRTESAEEISPETGAFLNSWN